MIAEILVGSTFYFMNGLPPNNEAYECAYIQREFTTKVTKVLAAKTLKEEKDNIPPNKLILLWGECRNKGFYSEY